MKDRNEIDEKRNELDHTSNNELDHTSNEIVYGLAPIACFSTRAETLLCLSF